MRCSLACAFSLAIACFAARSHAQPPVAGEDPPVPDADEAPTAPRAPGEPAPGVPAPSTEEAPAAEAAPASTAEVAPAEAAPTESESDAPEAAPEAAPAGDEAALGLLNRSAPAESDGAPAKARAPWNGAFLKVSEEDRSASALVSLPISGGNFLLNGRVAAPLDSDSRLSPLLDPRIEQLAFQFRLGLEYNAMERYLENLLASAETREKLLDCKRFWEDWKETHPDEPRPSCQPSDPKGEYQRWKKERTDQTLPGRTDGVFSRPVPLGVLWTLGFEFDASYDRQQVYVDDIAEAPVGKSATTLEAKLVGSWYPASWLGIPVKLGAGYEDKLRLKKLERCEPVNSSSSDVAGEACTDALFLEADEDSSFVANGEVALVFSFPVAGSVAPGFELRERLRGLGGTPRNTLSLALFASPTSEPVISRFGVGIEYNTALKAQGELEKGETWLVPFVLVGAGI